MKSIVVLISGQGSNLAALIAANRTENWPAKIKAVFSNRKDAGGLAHAEMAGIATHVLDGTSYADREAYDRALMAQIDRYEADLVVLAGFMRILSDAFVHHYEGRMLNIHPALLPSFPGLHPHRQALAAGVKIHGATVHFVTTRLDAGPIVIQAALPVLPSDDEASLGARVLKLEHQIYPKAVRWFVENRLVLDGDRVMLRGQSEAMSLGVTS